MLSLAVLIVVYSCAASMVLSEPLPCNNPRYDGWCLRNGTCMYIKSLFGDYYYCECPLGWTGKTCQKVDPGVCPGYSLRCVHGVCHIHSYLQDVSTPYCECFNGWSGDDCSLLCNKTCYHGGKCSVYNVTSDGYLQRCVCTDAYLPPQCIYCTAERSASGVCDNATIVKKLHDIQECKRSCVNGDCGDVDTVGDVACACGEGWVGAACDVPCTQTCINGGKCVSLYGDPYTHGCKCPPKWRSDRCETPCRITEEGKYDCSTFLPDIDNNPGFTEQNRLRCLDLCTYGDCERYRFTKNERPDGYNYRCVCSNRTVWFGEWCDITCPCMNNASCTLKDNKPICHCPVTHIGPICNETNPLLMPEIRSIQEEVRVTSVNQLWRVVIGCLLGIVALIGVMCLLLYILWRRRVLWVMKVKYFLQPSEQNDGRAYDAFVSYCGCNHDRSQNADEEFVIYKLLPKLENDLGYSLCLHQRDFIPGEAIADNIMSAVDKSRRTILVLSQRYVKSEWCKLEYNVAHQEMLKLRHRIIPIMLEDPDDIPTDEPILEMILKNITYIKYPGEKNEKKLEHFWKKIQYSMPKKRVLPGHGPPELVIERGDSVIKVIDEHVI